MKYSWQRQIILETIQEHKEHLSAQQIYGYARERCPISAWARCTVT